MASEEDDLPTRVAWLYYIGGLNQEMVGERLGLTRARVNKMLGEARESGLVTISINGTSTASLDREQRLMSEFNLAHCIVTPSLGTYFSVEATAELAFRAVGMAAARHLRAILDKNPTVTIGTGWGRTLAQMAAHFSETSAASAKFVSMMGSLTSNDSYSPFDVVHTLARRSGAESYFVPAPFVADTPADRDFLLGQRPIQRSLSIAREADYCFMSVGELTENSLLRRKDIISQEDLTALKKAGAVGDTNGFFFDANGRAVDSGISRRLIAVDPSQLQKADKILLVAGINKLTATRGLLKSGLVNSMIIDGDTAERLAS